MKKMKYKFKTTAKLLTARFLAMFLFVCTAAIPSIAQQTVNLVIDPVSSNVVVGQEFVVKVKVDFESGSINVAEVHLDFQTTDLQVVSITKTPLLPNIASDNTGNISNVNSTGRIEFAAGVPNTTISTDFDLLTITFRALKATVESPTTIIFGTTFPRKSEVANNGVSVLKSLVNGEVNINAPSSTEGVDFLLDPLQGNILEGQNLHVKIKVHFNSGSINVAEAHLQFDKARLEVLSITKSTVLPNVALDNTWNISGINNTGIISYAAGIANSSVNTDFDFLDILFKGRAVPPGSVLSAPLNFLTTFPNKTDAALEGISVLNSVATGGAVQVISNTALPINLEYFRGEQKTNMHLLSWKAECIATGGNFDLMRSSDGRAFSSIYTTSVPQEKCIEPLGYVDEQPLSGANYYRLKMIDIDGKLTYSSIILLLNSKVAIEVIGLQPTIVQSSNTKLNVLSSRNVAMEVQFTDMLGRMIMKKTVAVNSGANLIDLDVSSLSKGTYSVNCIVSGESAKILRFVKQ